MYITCEQLSGDDDDVKLVPRRASSLSPASVPVLSAAAVPLCDDNFMLIVPLNGALVALLPN